MKGPQPSTGYWPNAAQSSAFFRDLDEPDMSMGMAEMHGSNTIHPGLDDELNLEGSTGRDSTSEPIRLIMPRANKEETSNTSETVPRPTPQATVDSATLERLMEMFKSEELRGEEVRLARMP